MIKVAIENALAQTVTACNELVIIQSIIYLNLIDPTVTSHDILALCVFAFISNAELIYLNLALMI